MCVWTHNETFWWHYILDLNIFSLLVFYFKSEYIGIIDESFEQKPILSHLLAYNSFDVSDTSPHKDKSYSSLWERRPPVWRCLGIRIKNWEHLCQQDLTVYYRKILK